MKSVEDSNGFTKGRVNRVDRHVLDICVDIISEKEVITMRKMGRPKGADNLDTVYTIRLNKQLAARLEEYCRLYSISKSEIIRNALSDYLNTQNKVEEM